MTYFWETKSAEELYDLDEDPDQVTNLVNDPEYKAIRDELRGELARQMIEIRDLGLLPENEIHELVSRFIALPEESMHATGGAVDALIYDTKEDRVLDFGNNEGLKLELNQTCYPHHPGISAEARQNRDLLMRVFEEEEFVVDCLEYWHFDYGNVRWAAGRGTKVAHFGIIEGVEG